MSAPATLSDITISIGWADEEWCLDCTRCGWSRDIDTIRPPLPAVIRLAETHLAKAHNVEAVNRSAPDVTAALRGPWQAVLSIPYGATVVEDLDGLGPKYTVAISIRRRSALPEGGYLPGSGVNPDDLIELWPSLYAEDAPARWAQAQAMAAGLNAAGGEDR